MFTISEFSKTARVPVTQLRYYEKISLFRPQHVDDINSYRYYTVEQLPELSRILALKELGLSLKQITKLVQENVSAEEIRGMYTLRKAQIEQNLSDETNRLKVVETHLKQLEHLNTDERADVSLKSVPAQAYISHRETFADSCEVGDALLELQNHARQHLGVNAGHLTTIKHDKGFTIADSDIEFGYVLNKMAKPLELPSGRVLSPSELPELETVASMVCVGSVDDFLVSYSDLGEWLANNQYELLTPDREVLIVPPSPTDIDSAVVEIQFPVRAKSLA
jgi:DNA-binding transcriptional MerR regulator